MVAQCILSLLGPRLSERELPIFVSMVREVFVGSSSTEAGSLQLQSTADDAGLLLSPQHNCSGPTGMVREGVKQRCMLGVSYLGTCSMQGFCWL